MRIQQQKSACCQAKVRRYGSRRRQCAQCRTTWRVWPRKRGRPTRRPFINLLGRYLNHGCGSLGSVASAQGRPRASLQYRLTQARQHFNRRTGWREPPDEPLILVADGLQQTFADGQVLTVYLVLVRAVDGGRAVILPPVALAGRETADGWQMVFAGLDDELLGRVRALVCDGAIGLVSLAQAHGWVLQRCHFHLWHSLNNYLRQGRLSRSQPLAGKVHQLVRTVLGSADDQRAWGAVCRLQALLPELRSSGARQILSGFTKHWLDYRSYIYHDKLNLPITSNSAESCIALVRGLQQRAHGWASPGAFLAWTETILKHRQTISCQVSEDQPNYLA